MKTGPQYRQSLLDGRRCYMDGELIKDPSAHPLLARATTNVADTESRRSRCLPMLRNRQP